MDNYDVIVIGGGHAGTEASLAAARLGCKTLLLSMHLDTIGLMSCNPAIGGVGKGQLVKEIDALGGQMAKAADQTAIQYRILNTSKGEAVRSTRCQSDRQRYRLYIKSILEKQENLSLHQTLATKILVYKGAVEAIETSLGEKFFTKTLIVTPGTFLNGLIHVGLMHFPGGRIGEAASISLSKNLKELGFSIMRFKTGTCARLDGRSINFKRLKKQPPERDIPAFSFSNRRINPRQIPCYITYTNKRTHEIIRSGLDRSPLYTGKIKSTGVRYCPSIEDKVVKFSDKERHQIFLEPEGFDTVEFYPNGLSTSLPLDIQIKMLRSIEGLEEVQITRPGYGIEHDVVDPLQIYSTLETKLIQNLYLAGQINGTTGYEEAAAQGLIAGINAALKVKGKVPLILDRSTSYIGVLIDDLTTKGTNEPYRMFTSRVEYRLLLREDNADLRLRETGHKLGLVSKADYLATQKKNQAIQEQIKKLKEIKLRPSIKINARLKRYKSSPINKVVALEEILRRPEIKYGHLKKLSKKLSSAVEAVKQQVEIQIKYSGFIQRQLKEVERFKNLEKIKIPPDFDYQKLGGLSKEVKEKLSRFKPLSLGQASRISGVTPAAISILMVRLKK